MVKGDMETLATELAHLIVGKDRRHFSVRDSRGSGSSDLGAAVKYWREHCGLSFAELGRRSGLHPTTIEKIETGDRGMSMKTLSRLGPELGDSFVEDVLGVYRR